MAVKAEVFMKKVQTEFGDMENIFEIVKFEQDNCLEYWNLFFNFSYRTLYCPFRLVWNSSGFYEMKSYNIFAKISRWVAILMGNLLFLYSMKSLMDNFSSENKEIHYFEFASLFLAASYLLYSHCVLWYKRDQILSIATQMMTITKSFQPAKQDDQFRLSFRMRAALIVIWIGFIKIALTISSEFEQNEWSFQQWWTWKESCAPKLIFHSHFLWTGLYTLVNLYNAIAITQADSFLLATALLYCNILSNFCSSLENQDFHQVMSTFKRLKQLTANMNDVFGLYILGFTFSVTSFYTVHLLSIMYMPAVTSRLLNILYTVHFAAVFYQIAKANSMWDRFYLWLKKKENYENENLSLKELTVILHESNSNALGIPEIFVVTYSSLGKLAGMVLTYIVVVMQLRDSTKKQ